MDDIIYQDLPNGNQLQAKRIPPPENRYLLEVISPEGKVVDSFDYVLGDPGDDPAEAVNNPHIDEERREAVEALMRRLI